MTLDSTYTGTSTTNYGWVGTSSTAGEYLLYSTQADASNRGDPIDNPSQEQLRRTKQRERYEEKQAKRKEREQMNLKPVVMTRAQMEYIVYEDVMMQESVDEDACYFDRIGL